MTWGLFSGRDRIGWGLVDLSFGEDRTGQGPADLSIGEDRTGQDPADLCYDAVSEEMGRKREFS
jgi:hypothetical protein